MKKLIFFLLMGFVSIGFYSCQKNDIEDMSDITDDIIPNAFRVDIPDAISSTDGYGVKSGLKSSMASDDSVNGNEVYEMLRYFIAVGEFSSELNEYILTSVDYFINLYKVVPPAVFTYESDSDNRTKETRILSNKVYNGVTYDYFMQVKDVKAADEELNNDGIGMQIYWSLNPVKGVSVLRPYNIDRSDTVGSMSTTFMKVAYFQQSTEPGYEEHMEVEISGLPTNYPGADQYAVDRMKMFVGKNGDIVDVKGNSNHPNAYFFDDTRPNGFNWAFVASGKESMDIGVAEVGLPAMSLNTTQRDILLDTNSLYNVWFDLVTDYLTFLYPTADQQYIDSVTDIYLTNTKGPGFFDQTGFLSAETAPANITDGRYDDLVSRLPNMTPFSPAEVSTLTIDFAAK